MRPQRPPAFSLAARPAFGRAAPFGRWQPPAPPDRSPPPPPVPPPPAPPAAGKRYLDVPSLALPPVVPPPMPLGEALARRRSCRLFADRPLALDTLATLLGGAWQVGPPVEVPGLGPLRPRPTPSAGGCYPLELYLLVRSVASLDAGVHAYDPFAHRLLQLRGPLPWPSVVGLFQGQRGLSPAAAVAVITGVPARNTPRYGPWAGSLMTLEAGHLAQTVALLAAAAGVGCLPLGCFDAAGVAALLDVDPRGEPPLHAFALGPPASDDPGRVRALR